MNFAKLFVVLNTGFYTLYGLYGALLPHGMAGLMGWTPDLLGLHQIRAISMAMAVMGVFAALSATKTTDHKPLVLAFIALTLAFAAGRFLGLFFDGTGPTQTYGEIALEIFCASIGYLALRKAARSSVA